MTNQYHIIDKIPIYQRFGMELEYEELAQQLVRSGLLRIDTDDKRNFVYFNYPTRLISKSFSYRELHDEKILGKRTYIYLTKIFGQADNAQATSIKVKNEIDKLKKEFKKLQAVNEELELKLARLFVQAAHPMVIRFLLIENVDVFIAYSNIIGDVMDVRTWQVAGQNSGMQSVDSSSTSIFVACGGDPFTETSIEHPTYGDGWPAAARLQIIAAQELGHYADIVRDVRLNYVDRHSANLQGTRAKDKISQGRAQDIITTNNFITSLSKFGIDKLIYHEQNIKFFRKNKVFNLRYIYNLALSYYHRSKLIRSVANTNYRFILKFRKEKYLGLMLKALSEDMLFNLSPKADVYKRDDKHEENAIACVEALARVPQQVIKWGHLSTRYFMQNLYNAYYGEVIPSLIEIHNIISGKTYIRSYELIQYPLIQPTAKLYKSLIKFWSSEVSAPSREI